MNKTNLAMIFTAVLVFGCTGFASAKVAEIGDIVTVDYISYIDEYVYDTTLPEMADNAISREKFGGALEPLKYELGHPEITQAFNTIIEGMKKGENRTVKVPIEQVFGEYNPFGEYDSTKLFVIEREKLEDSELEIIEGLIFEINVSSPIEMIGLATIKQIGYGGDENLILVDLNHPLSGKPVTFTIFLRDLEKK